MPPTFILKLILSFVIGGSWVILATYYADKLGAKIGGLVAGLPSTLLFGLFFLAWTRSPEVAVRATTIVPAIAGVNALFLTTFAGMSEYELLATLGASFAVWALLAAFALHLQLSFLMTIIAYLICLSLAHVLMQHVLKVKTVKGKLVVYTPVMVAARGVLSGLFVALTVWIGTVGSPLLAGLAGSVPATFTATLIISRLTHGTKFAASVAKSILFPAASIVIYSTAVRYTYVPLGLVFGTLVSSVIAALSGYAIYTYVVRKLD